MVSAHRSEALSFIYHLQLAAFVFWLWTSSHADAQTIDASGIRKPAKSAPRPNSDELNPTAQTHISESHPLSAKFLKSEQLLIPSNDETVANPFPSVASENLTALSSTPSLSPETSSPTLSPSFSPVTSEPSQSPIVSSPTQSPQTTSPTLTPTRSPSSHPSSSPTPPARSNVLLLIVDDLKPLLGSYGSTLDATRSTPNMDIIASRGTRFLNAHAQMSLCGPSRASFLTSLRPDTTEVLTIKDRSKLFVAIQQLQRKTGKTIMTLPEIFKSNGYETYGVGKIFHENELELMSAEALWTEPIRTWNKAGTGSIRTNPYEGDWSQTIDVPDDHYADGQAANLAVDLLQHKLNHGELHRPWLLAVGFWKPHLPWHVPLRYWNRTTPASNFQGFRTIAKPVGLTKTQYHITRGNGCNEINAYSGKPPYGLNHNKITTPQAQEAIRLYFAAIDYVDAQVGRVLAALDASRAANATHVVLLSDHGFHLGDHGIFCKHTNFEQSTRVPFVIAPARQESSWPRNKGAMAPVELLDLLPTLAELTGVKLPQGGQGQPKVFSWEGQSLAGIMQRPSDTWVKNAAMSQFSRPRQGRIHLGYSLRTTRYRATIWCPRRFRDKMAPSKKACFMELYDYFERREETTSIWESEETVRKSFVKNFFGINKDFKPKLLPPFDFHERHTAAEIISGTSKP